MLQCYASHLSALALLLVAGCSAPTASEAEATAEVDVQALTIEPALEDKKERTNLSGSACSPSGTCLLIGDEKRYARFFTLNQARLIPGQKLLLLFPEKDADGEDLDESDGEGIAFADGYFYVAGSHSNDRDGDPQASRHFLYRIPCPDTGLPSDLGGDVGVSALLESTSLDYLITADDDFEPHLKQAAGEYLPGRRDNNFPVDQHGVNIEGIAVRGGRTFIGFRGPVDSRGAVIWELPTEELFEEGGHPPAVVRRLKLGTGELAAAQGVRDLAAVSDGLLILAGPEMRSVSEEVQSDSGKTEKCVRACPTATLFFWAGGDEEPVPITLPEIDFAGDSPEAITVLSEDADSYRLLVLSDGEKEIGPRIVRVAKPRAAN